MRASCVFLTCWGLVNLLGSGQVAAAANHPAANWSLVGMWTAEGATGSMAIHYRALLRPDGSSTLITISEGYAQKDEGTYAYTYLSGNKGLLETTSRTGTKQTGEITWNNEDEVIYTGGGYTLTYHREREASR
jgi:hypothetical protein